MAIFKSEPKPPVRIRSAWHEEKVTVEVDEDHLIKFLGLQGGHITDMRVDISDGSLHFDWYRLSKSGVL